MIDLAQKSEYLEWAEERLGNKIPRSTTITVLHEGQIAAVAVFSNYIGHSVEFSIASSTPKWGRRSAFKAFGAYAFQQLKVHRVWCVTRATNTHAQQQLIRLGFKREGILRQHYADRADGHIFALLR